MLSGPTFHERCRAVERFSLPTLHRELRFRTKMLARGRLCPDVYDDVVHSSAKDYVPDASSSRTTAAFWRRRHGIRARSPARRAMRAFRVARSAATVRSRARRLARSARRRPGLRSVGSCSCSPSFSSSSSSSPSLEYSSSSSRPSISADSPTSSSPSPMPECDWLDLLSGRCRRADDRHLNYTCAHSS